MTVAERVFVCLLAVPLFALTVASLLREEADSNLKANIHVGSPETSDPSFHKITVASLCHGEIPDVLRTTCEQDRVQRTLGVCAVAVGAAGVAWASLTALAGRLAQRRRDLLLVFKPGLYLTGIAVIVLLAMHAALLVSAMVLAGVQIFGEVYPHLLAMMAAVALSVVIGIAGMIGKAFFTVRKTRSLLFVLGEPLSRDQAPGLWALVDDVAAHLGTPRPDHLFVGMESNFFVTEGDVSTIREVTKGRTLHCSLPLCRILTREELKAILAHELAHFHGEDTKFSEQFAPIYRSASEALASLQRTTSEGVWRMAKLPAIAVFTYFLHAFSAAERRFARERELAADATGAARTETRKMASALVKVHAFEGLWRQTIAAAAEALHAGRTPPNVSAAFAEAVSTKATASDLQQALSQTLTHPTDSHPPLSVRLTALGVALEDVATATLAVPPPTESAASLIDNLEHWEEETAEGYIALHGIFAVVTAPTSDAALAEG